MLQVRPEKPTLQEPQVVELVQVRQLVGQVVQVGPLEVDWQNWLEVQEAPQSGEEQVAPFQPGRQAVQTVALVQEAQLAGQAWQALLEQNWPAAQPPGHREAGTTASMAAAFRRPPVEVMPFWREAVGVAEFRMAVLTSAAVAEG